jgi:hypothetical protein
MLQTILWGGRFNIAGQLSDSSSNQFVITNHSATKNPSTVVSVQTSQRINGGRNRATVWESEATRALSALVPDFEVYGLMYVPVGARFSIVLMLLLLLRNDGPT